MKRKILSLFWLLVAVFQLVFALQLAPAKSIPGLKNCIREIFSLAAQTSQPNPSQVSQGINHFQSGMSRDDFTMAMAEPGAFILKNGGVPDDSVRLLSTGQNSILPGDSWGYKEIYPSGMIDYSYAGKSDAIGSDNVTVFDSDNKILSFQRGVSDLVNSVVAFAGGASDLPSLQGGTPTNVNPVGQNATGAQQNGQPPPSYNPSLEIGVPASGSNIAVDSEANPSSTINFDHPSTAQQDVSQRPNNPASVPPSSPDSVTAEEPVPNQQLVLGPESNLTIPLGATTPQNASAILSVQGSNGFNVGNFLGQAQNLTASYNAEAPGTQLFGMANSGSTAQQLELNLPGSVSAAPNEVSAATPQQLGSLTVTAPPESGTLDALTQGSRFWTTSEFQGTTVYQRDDLIDPTLLDDLGRNNLQRMQQGLAPIGSDGAPINLHHTLQSDDSPIAELTQTFHQDYSDIIHINPNTIPSGIDRGAFNSWRRAYWMNRANDFGN